jgi:hypothetical protein
LSTPRPPPIGGRSAQIRASADAINIARTRRQLLRKADPPGIHRIIHVG